jgi:uncharacterized repeat protein (TIGR01451 family)
MTNLLSFNRIVTKGAFLVGMAAFVMIGLGMAASADAAKPFSISVNGDTNAKPTNLVTFIINIENKSGVQQNGVHVFINDATITPNNSLMFIDSPTGSNCSRVSFPINGTPNTGLKCELNSLAAGATTHVQLRYKVLPTVACGSSIVYVIDVGADGAEADWASHTLNIDACPNNTTVKIEKVGPVDITQLKGAKGQSNLVYRLRATNTGSVVATAVRVNDNVPTGTTFVSATDGCVLGANGTTGQPEVHCPAFDLQPGQSADRFITVKLGADVACGAKVKNQADVSASNAPAAWSNEFVTDIICPGTTPTPTPTATPTPTPKPEVKKELNVSKTDHKDLTRPGNTLTYIITVENNGNVDIADLKITDTVPGKLTVTSIGQDGKLAGSVITWSNVKLGAGESKQVTFKALVKEDTANGTVLNNKVKARSEDHDLTDDANDTTLVQRAAQVAAAVTTPVAVPVTAKTGAGAAIALITTLTGAAGLVSTLRKTL